MAVPTSLSSLNPSKYAWQRHASTSYRRLPLSTESLWISRPREARHIFVVAELALHQPSGILTILEVAREAWRRMRYLVPELQLGSVVDGKEVYLQYDCPSCEEDVDVWVERTIQVETSNEALNFPILRRLLVGDSKATNDPVSLLLYFQYEDGQERNPPTKLWCALDTDHLVTDGIGTRIILGRFLATFSKILGEEQAPVDKVRYSWDDSWNNLSPPWIAITNKKQRYSGKEYVCQVTSNRNYLFQTQVIENLVLYDSPSLFDVTSTSISCSKNLFLMLIKSHKDLYSFSLNTVNYVSVTLPQI